MEFSQYFTVWNKLNPSQQALIEASLIYRKEPKGTIVHNGSTDCAGLMLIRSGQLRAYILSDEGREVTIYRFLIGISVCFPLPAFLIVSSLRL